jgi:hypothetical protein
MNEDTTLVGWCCTVRSLLNVRRVGGAEKAWSRRVNQNDLLREKQWCKLLPAGSCRLHADLEACIRQDTAREQKTKFRSQIQG